mgnify:FL=1
MKKLLLVVPFLASLAACTSTPVAQPTPSQVLAVQANSQTYKCDNNTEVVAFYTQNDNTNMANLKITSPMLGLNQAAMVLKQDVSGSGTRYTLANSAKTTMYDWAVKGNDAALTVTSQGRDYDFVCSAI